jgi:hypothetical protein
MSGFDITMVGRNVMNKILCVFLCTLCLLCASAFADKIVYAPDNWDGRFGVFVSPTITNTIGNLVTTNQGVNIQPGTNMSISIAGGVAMLNVVGVMTNAVVKPITTTGATNPVFILSESENVWNWTPPTNVPLTCTFSVPGAGFAASGMLRLVRTNNDNSVTWPTNVLWSVNGTLTTNPPLLSNYNRIIVDSFNLGVGKAIRLGLWTTNTVEL